MRATGRTRRLEHMVEPPWWKFMWKRRSSQYAALQLWKSGPRSVPFLLRMARRKEGTPCAAVASALERIGPDDVDALSALVLALKEYLPKSPRDPDFEMAVCNAIARMGSSAEPALPSLVDALPRALPGCQEALVDAIGNIGPTALSALRRILQDGKHHWQARKKAAERLEAHVPRGRGTVSALLKGLEDRHSAVRHAAAHALESAGMHTVKDVVGTVRKSRLKRAGLSAEDLPALLLVKRLHSERVEEIVEACHALAAHRAEGDRIWQKLEGWLAPNPEEVEAHTELNQSIEILICDLLTEKDREQRVQYLRELGRRKQGWLVPLLKHLAEDQAEQEAFRYMCQEVAEWI